MILPGATRDVKTESEGYLSDGMPCGEYGEFQHCLGRHHE